MFSRATKEVNAEFLADEQYLESIRRIVKESCATAGLPRKDTAAVILAIEEGATNIIRHAYLYEKGTLRLRIVIYKRLMAFSLIDSGRSFQPQQSGRLDLEKLVESGRKGGLGFYMIQKIMDSVEYISAAGFNELRMFKRLQRTATGTPPLLRRLLTLRVKFSVFTFAIVALIVGATFWYVDRRSKKEVYAHLDETVTALANTISQQTSAYLLNRRSDVEFDELVVSYVRSNPFVRQVVLTDSAGLILAHSDDIRNIRKTYQVLPEVNSLVDRVPQRFTFRGDDLNYFRASIRAGDFAVGSVHIIYSSAPILAQLADARRATLLLAGALLFVGILGIYLLSNYFVNPIVKITERVRRFTSGDLETELPLEGADEFFEISRALNDMITRLSRDRRNLVERERMTKEIEVASQIQKTLLPGELPRLPGLDVDAFYRAASIVGGDLYDIVDAGGGCFFLTVADVSGKGVPASLVMSMLRTVIQISARDRRSPREVLLAVNDYLVSNMPAGMFVTVLTAMYEAGSRRLVVVSAGHTPLLLYRAADQSLLRINPAGMPIGVDAGAARSFADCLEETEVTLAEGDLVFMYTDGITDAVDRDRRQFGFERLAGFLASQMAAPNQPLDVRRLSRLLVDEVDAFSGLTRQNDDITFLIAGVTAERTVPAPRPLA